MDSREGQLYDHQGDCNLSDPVEISNVVAFGLDEMKGRGLQREGSGLSQFFWASEEEEMESAPHDMRQKWKRMMQKWSTVVSPVDDDEVAGASDNVESKWQDMPMEVLVRILALVDNRTVIVASGVCMGWKESIRMGIVELSLSCLWPPKFSCLQSCNLRRCSLLNDQAIEAVAANWHDLRALDLTNGTRLTDLSLYALANGCPHLEKLDLSGCVRITEAGLVLFAQHCHHLRHLNLCGCNNAGSDAALLALAQNCSGLQSLNVGWCEDITDMGVTALALGCPDLCVIDLCGCILITDRSVIVLANTCQRLRGLGLHCCRNITDLAMYSLAKSSRFHNKVQNCFKHEGSHSNNNVARDHHSGNAGHFISSCSTFSRSSTDSCSSSNGSYLPAFSKGAFEVLQGDPKGYGLVSLNLSGCTALSALAVQAVCDAFPELHTCPERPSLVISGCLNLTSVHCICVVEARRDRASRAAFKAMQSFNPKNRPL